MGLTARIRPAGAWLLCAVLAACAGRGQPGPAPAASGGNALKISSTAFTEGSSIPRKYTCDAENVSPPLAFGDVPAGAQTLALIADDPDAPAGTWVHWVLFNVPAQVGGLPEGVPAGDTLGGGGTQGTSSFNRSAYGGPCPPSGTHRYYFKLYALDTTLNLRGGARANDLQAAMQGHVLAQAQLMGRYQRSK